MDEKLEKKLLKCMWKWQKKRLLMTIIVLCIKVQDDAQLLFSKCMFSIAENFRFYFTITQKKKHSSCILQHLPCACYGLHMCSLYCS